MSRAGRILRQKVLKFTLPLRTRLMRLKWPQQWTVHWRMAFERCWFKLVPWKLSAWRASTVFTMWQLGGLSRGHGDACKAGTYMKPSVGPLWIIGCKVWARVADKISKALDASEVWCSFGRYATWKVLHHAWRTADLRNDSPLPWKGRCVPHEAMAERHSRLQYRG